jgi:hypothetical protein
MGKMAFRREYPKPLRAPDRKGAPMKVEAHLITVERPFALYEGAPYNAEEIADLGQSIENAIESHLDRLLLHPP